MKNRALIKPSLWLPGSRAREGNWLFHTNAHVIFLTGNPTDVLFHKISGINCALGDHKVIR